MESSYIAIGRRKNAIARVVLRPGKGERIINGLQVKAYLRSETLSRSTEQPFDLLQVGSSYDVVAKVVGGGLSGQSGAVRLGISRALAKISEEFRKQLRKGGYLTRDSRAVERKKYGQPGARKRFQFSKR